MATATHLITSSKKLRTALNKLKFSPPTHTVYNPLDYAWAPYQDYLKKWGNSRKKVIFLGMNPGPWGMAQVGIPFGEISLVRDWITISGKVTKPKNEHPKKPVLGFDCQRSEVSGKRLWGLFSEKFPSPKAFFKEHYVANYCPLAFLEEGGKNRTPDKLPATEKEQLFNLCDQHLREIVTALKPNIVIGVGKFAEERAKIALNSLPVEINTILHPSPANPMANKGWGVFATKKLKEIGVW